MQKTRRSGMPTWVGSALTLIAAVTATGVIWVLADQNRTLKESLAANTNTSRSKAGLKAGDILPDLALTSVAGDSQTLYAITGNGVAVLGLMTTTCPYCEANLPRWAELSTSLREEGIPFASISINDADEVRAYGQQHGIDWPLWATTPGQLQRSLSVPTTVVLGPGGTVITSTTGVLSLGEIAQLTDHAISSQPTPRGPNDAASR